MNSFSHGTLIHHIPNTTKSYIGSPSLVILSDGSYVASHDCFGPATSEFQSGKTLIFRSTDRGCSWFQAAELSPAFWSGLFVHRDELYLLGTTCHHGLIVIRKSSDGGITWTEARDGRSGLLTETGQYHTAPLPVLSYEGRLWRAFEDAQGGTEWGTRYRPRMLSAPEDADLLLARSWTLSASPEKDLAWLDGQFRGWLEGNAVITPEGIMGNLLRVNYGRGGKAALLSVTDKGRGLAFDPATGFIDMPGAATKFTVRYDLPSQTYWSLVNDLPENYSGTNAQSIRNTLVMVRSKNLRNWKQDRVVLHHADEAGHGFQYADWVFDGEDIVAAVRTAASYKGDRTTRAHDANMLTFHRVADFREAVCQEKVSV